MDDRPTVSELLRLPFMVKSEAGELYAENSKEKVVNDLDWNCYQLHVAHVLNEIVHRQITINNLKDKSVGGI